MSAVKPWLFRMSAPAFLLIPGFFAGFSAPGALADAGGLYAGVTASAERLDTTYHKQLLLSSQGALNDRDSADEVGFGFGVLAGYRMPLNENGVYLGGELDWRVHEGTMRGRLRGVPMTPGAPPPFTNNGDSWPERWRFEKEYSYGLTLQLGMPLSAPWAGPGASVYLLGGFRRVNAQFDTRFAGCDPSSPPGCMPGTTDLYASYTESQDRVTTAWTWGAGLEKRIGEATALRGEIRYTEYENDRRTNEYPGPPPSNDPVVIPRDLDSDEVGLSLGLIRYF